MEAIRKMRGFTLIEILVVIGIIAILAAIVIIAINPAKQFAQARNTTRESNINTILNGVGQNIADNKGLPLSATTCAGIGTVPGAAALHIGATAGMVDLTCLVPTYIPTAIPTDPGSAGTPVVPVGTAADTQYTIAIDAVGRYTICAPGHQENSVPASALYCLTR